MSIQLCNFSYKVHEFFCTVQKLVLSIGLRLVAWFVNCLLLLCGVLLECPCSVGQRLKGYRTWLLRSNRIPSSYSIKMHWKKTRQCYRFKCHSYSFPLHGQVMILATAGKYIWHHHHRIGLRIHCQQMTSRAPPKAGQLLQQLLVGLLPPICQQLHHWWSPGTVCCYYWLRLLSCLLDNSLWYTYLYLYIVM